jgi:hypothetical protein
MDKGVDVFIDSGAFSAKNCKAVISIDSYIRFIVELRAENYVSWTLLTMQKKLIKTGFI